MPRDARLNSPEQTINKVDSVFRKNAQINYSEAFKAKATQPPFDINHFDASDLKNKLLAKKQVQNPGLNFVSDDPQNFELFSGLGRFDTNRGELYNFEQGGPNTRQRFTQSPEYNPMWGNLYQVSPTIKPSDRISNPFPRLKNPDPKGYIMAAAESRAENDYEENYSVARLLRDPELMSSDDGNKEESTEDKTV
jgi:hypothetical protein